MHFWWMRTHWLHSIYPQSLNQSPTEQARAVTMFHPFFTVLPLSISNSCLNWQVSKIPVHKRKKKILFTKGDTECLWVAFMQPYSKMLWDLGYRNNHIWSCFYWLHCPDLKTTVTFQSDKPKAWPPSPAQPQRGNQDLLCSALTIKALILWRGCRRLFLKARVNVLFSIAQLQLQLGLHPVTEQLLGCH